ncbi:MAG: DNA replication terminus site-binding protein [Enterobacter hormaechei]
MATYDLIEFNTTFREIEQALLTTGNFMTAARSARAFPLPEVAKGAEHDPLNTIEVTQHIGKAALN